MPKFKVLLFMAGVFLVACSEVDTGPVEVKWDRDDCARCRMVLSDRMHAAQVRGGPQGEKSKVYKFDDFGCAILWLDKQTWKDSNTTEIWVNDHSNGRWIDARQAYYITGQNTPMSFGLGAQDAVAEGALSFAQAVASIKQREASFNQPGSDLQGHMHEQHDHH